MLENSLNQLRRKIDRTRGWSEGVLKRKFVKVLSTKATLKVFSYIPA